MSDVNKLTFQLLELSKQLATSSKLFRITLKTEGINFSICSQDVDHPGQDKNHPGVKKEKKSKSPSQKKRNAERRKSFLMKKLEETNLSTKPFEVTDATGEHGDKVASSCDICDFRANCKVTLGKHIQKEHSQIPQFDGLEESSIKEVDPSPITCKECEFTSTSVKDMEDHIETEHSIKPLERPPEVKKLLKLQCQLKKGKLNQISLEHMYSHQQWARVRCGATNVRTSGSTE